MQKKLLYLSPTPASNILLPFVDGPRLYEYIIHVLQVDSNHQRDHALMYYKVTGIMLLCRVWYWVLELVAETG